MPEEKIVEVKEHQEYEADWDGTQQSKNFEKILIPEDSYNAKVKSIEIIQTPDFNDKTKKVDKIAIAIELTEGAGTGKELTAFIAPKIMKANPNQKGKTMSNSKLYDLLCDLGLREEARGILGNKITAEKVQDFLTTKMLGKNIRVSVKTSKANTPEAYSSVSKILRFL